MKKIYLLSLLCCLSIAGFSQTTTVTIWAHTAAAGTYITGNASSPAGVRTDNTIVATGAATSKRGYAVFNLSAIPAGSAIASVTAGFSVNAYTAGTITTTTYGYAGNLSTVTVGATLYADMIAGTALSTAAYTGATGIQTLASTAAATAFVQANIGSTISYCWTNAGTATFTIIGETGTDVTAGLTGDAPYLTITYCPPPTAVTASASPTVLCQGDALGLSGTYAVSGTVGYTWTGPGPYTSTVLSSTLTTSVTSSGVYTLTVTNTCAAGVVSSTTAVTPNVTVNPTPAITASPVCTGSTETLTAVPGGGLWVSTLPGVASIGSASGVVTGNSGGSATISYTSPAGCSNSTTVIDNDPPDPIAGPTSVCLGGSITLTDGISGGTWSDDGTGTVTADPLTGSVTGNVAGMATVSYVTGGCTAVSYTVTVVALPPAISGSSGVCVGSSTTLSDSDPAPGTWSSSNITLATVGSTGDVNGVAPGSLNIIFTDGGTLCQAVYPITVNALPAPIGGLSSVCVGSTITMTESTPGGVFSGTNAFASVDPTTGNVTGIAAGVTDVTYMVTTTNCDITKPVTVDPLPATIVTGTGTVCQGATITFTDPDPSGTWTSLNTSIASVGIVSGIITGTGAGSTSIIYTLPTGCTNSTTVAVNASPVSLVTASGPTTFCAGDSVLLTGSSGAGDIYQWNLAGVPIPGATTTSYTANATGAFTFSMTNALNCTTNSAVLNVVDGITGTIVNGTPLAFCQGYTALLYASTGSVSGSIDYQWQLNDVSIAGATDSSYAAPSAGEYKCLITITGGAGSCAVVSDSVALTVYSPPSPAISYNGHVLSTAGGFAGYQWYENTISIPGATNAVYLPVSNGTFKVRVTNSNDCSAFATDYDLTNVGVNEVNNQTEILISPNPATSSLHIESSVIVDASITDLEGKTVMTQLAAKEINITNLASGMYFIILSDQQGNRIEVDKFIKE